MKAITNLYKLEQDLAERLGSETATKIIKDYSVEIYHGWSNEDIDDLIEIVAEGITEIKNNDDNAE